jgi:predicted Rossmann-fold nucleotide-binding protein
MNHLAYLVLDGGVGTLVELLVLVVVVCLIVYIVRRLL